MTDYKGPNAFSGGGFKPAKEPKSIGTYARSPGGVVRNNNGPAFNNKFPKSRYPRGGGQSGLRPVLEVAGGGGGGGDYVSQAASFDGTSSLSRGGPLTGWDTASKFIFSITVEGLQENNGYVFSTLYNQYLGLSVDSGTGFFDFSSYGSPSGGVGFSTTEAIPAGRNTFTIACDLTDENKNALYMNGVLIEGAVNFQAGGLTFGLNEEIDFFVGQDGYSDFQTGKIGEFYLALGQWIDLSTNIDKFFADGGPVYLGVDGSLPTGIPPSVCLSKNNQDATLFTENRGTGGPVTLNEGGVLPIVDWS